MVLDILDREGGAVRVTIGAIVMKEFKHDGAVQRVTKLVEIYDLLKMKGVPNVDTLVKYKLDGRHPWVHLEPVGIHTLPKSGFECFSAVTCVLKALEVRFEVSVFII